MSRSRGCAPGETRVASSASSSVVCPIADTTTQTWRPASRSATTRRATWRIRSGSPTDVPPYFCTTSCADTSRNASAGRARGTRPDPTHGPRVAHGYTWAGTPRTACGKRGPRPIDASAAARANERGADERGRNGQHQLQRLGAAEARFALGSAGHVDRYLLQPQPRIGDADQRLHLGGAARELVGEERQRLRVDGPQAARRIAERPAEHNTDRAPEHGRPEPARGARPVAVLGVPRSRDEAGADRDIAAIRPHELEQPLELRRRVLPVGVDTAAERVLVIARPPVPGGDRDPQPAVPIERQHLCAVPTRDRGRPVRRAVVDDEQVDVRQPGANRSEHRADARLLVPRRHEDDGVSHVSPARGALLLAGGASRRPRRAPTRPLPAWPRPARDGLRSALPRCRTGA